MALFQPLMQISSDIIKRCCAQVSLDDVFDGYVERSRAALEESIHCCIYWKKTYGHVSKVHNKHSAEGWVLDESSIFAHVDAFIQRCNDLLEVVVGQVCPKFGNRHHKCVFPPDMHTHMHACTCPHTHTHMCVKN